MQKGTRLGLIAGVAALVASAAPVSAGASSLLVVPVAPASVRLLADPAVALHVPPDGRINGDGFNANVAGYRFTNALDDAGATLKAAAGQRLLVFELDGAPVEQPPDSLTYGGQPAAVATLLVDGTEAKLPAPQTGTGPFYYLASVPAAAHDVAVEVSENNYAQTFSFSRDAREGAQPSVLYRSANDWKAVDTTNRTVTLPAPDPSGWVPDAGLDVVLKSATLTWFGPNGPGDNPPSSDQAWLVLDATAFGHVTYTNSVGNSLAFLSTLPASAVTLTIPGQPRIAATIGAQTSKANESGDPNGNGLLGGVYYFEVPATFTAGTITVTPGSVQAEGGVTAQPETVHVQGAASFPLAFTAPYQPTPPPSIAPATATNLSPAATTPAPRASQSADTTPTSKPASAHRPTGLPVPLTVGIIAGVAAILAGADLTRRRRRRPHATSAANHTFVDLNADVEENRQSPRADNDAYTQEVHVDEPGPPPSGGAQPAATPILLAPPVRLVEFPVSPEPLDDGTIEVQVLGTPQVAGWPADAPAPGQSVLELLCFLALHPGRSFTGEALRAELGIGRTAELKTRTIATYANTLRRAIGEAHLPDATIAGGYTLIGIRTDTARLEDALENVRHDDSELSLGRLAAALALVRGAPFAHAPVGAYGWADVALNTTVGNLVTPPPPPWHTKPSTPATSTSPCGPPNKASGFGPPTTPSPSWPSTPPVPARTDPP